MVDCHLKKIVKCNVSAIDSLFLIKLAVMMHISHCNFNSRLVQSKKDDNAESFNFLLFLTPKERKKSAKNHIHAKRVKY